MLRKLVVLAAFLVTLVAAMPLVAESRQRYTVVTNPDAPRAHTLRRLTSDSAEKVARRVRSFKHVSGYALDLTAEEAAALRNTAGVESVDPVVERWASSIVPGQVAPNFERYDSQVTPWGIPVVRAAEVWPVTRGEEINVAVLDTGIDWNHPDLQAAYEGGVNILDETKLPIDDNKHGTHVAGIIAATQNDFGIVGVAPGVKLWNVKVLDISGKGYDEFTAAGIDWVVEHQRQFGGRWVINMSLGAGVEGGKLERKAVERAFDAGIILVAAAGNRNADFLDFPAAYPGVIAVGAVGEDGKKAEFSSYGFGMPLVAPGVLVQSTLISGIKEDAEVATGPAGATLTQARGLIGSPFGTVSGKIVSSGTGSPEDFPAAVAGNIALIQRGGDLSFREKVRNAKNAGASAVIIWNHEDVAGTPLWTLLPRGCGPGEEDCPEEWKNYPFLVTVGISNADGLTFAQQGQQNGTVTYQEARYGRLSGTSMATPHVAGVAALILSLDPEMNPTQVESVLRITARDTAEPGWDYFTAWGIVDALAAAQYVAPERFDVPPPDVKTKRRSTRP